METWERGSESQSETEGRLSQQGLLSRDVMKPCHHGRDGADIRVPSAQLG